VGQGTIQRVQQTQQTIALPSAEDVDQYGVQYEPAPPGIPLIADDEAVCRVFAPDGASGGYWARGDVDVHVLHAKQHNLVPSAVAGVAPPDPLGEGNWLAAALRARREQRHRLQRGGVQTTGSGLVLLQQPRARLIVPPRP
jgi:hypothetical protein